MSLQIQVVQTPKFQAQAELDVSARLAKLIFKGTLDEASDLPKVPTYLSRLGDDVRSVVLNVQGIHNVNSTGLRMWFKFLESLAKAELQIAFESVSEIFLDRAQSFPGILGPEKTRIQSFEAPYFCPTCSLRKIVLLQSKDINYLQKPIVPPPAKCDQCKNTIQFDESPDNYFRFLKRAF